MTGITPHRMVEEEKREHGGRGGGEKGSRESAGKLWTKGGSRRCQKKKKTEMLRAERLCRTSIRQ